MSTRNFILIPTLVVAVLAVAVLVFVTDSTYRDQMDRERSGTVDEMIAQVSMQMDAGVAQCLSLASTFRAAPEVVQAYEDAHQGDLHAELDPIVESSRQRLRAALAPQRQGYREQVGDDLYLHFHLPTGRSFLRLWRDDQHNSDDLSSFRATVMQINQGRHEPIGGIEVGRGGFVFRGILPVRDAKGQHLGSVEAWKDFPEVIGKIDLGEHKNLAVFMTTDKLSVAQKLADESKYPRIDGRYVTVAATDQQLATRIVDAGMLDAAVSGTQIFTRSPYSIAVWPIQDFSGERIGAACALLDHSSQHAMLTGLRQKLGLIAGLLLLALGGLAWWISRAITRPLQGIARFTDHIGQGDLVVDVDIKARTREFATIAERLRFSRNQLRELIQSVSGETAQLSASSEQLSAAAAGMAAGSDEMRSQATSAASSIEQLSANLSNIASGSEEMSGTVTTVATAVEEMSASLSEVAKNCADASHVASNADEQAQHTTETMTKLNSSAGEIGKVVETINDIADQTNLLALNATIEAASAGEAGKGFAVVANEVKELAKQTAEATDEIGRLIGEMQVDTRSAVEAIELIGGVIGEVNSITQTIATAVEEQSATINEVAHSIGGASQAAGEVSRNIQEASTGADEVSSNVQNLNASIQLLAGGTVDTDQGAAELQKLSVRLDALVRRFRTGREDEFALAGGSGAVAGEAAEIPDLIAWGPELSTLVNAMDEEHKKLIRIINDLHRAMRTGQGHGRIQRLVGELADYSAEHFRDEEAFLESIGYPGLGEQRRLHETFVKKVHAYQRQIENGERILSTEVMAFLKDWLVNHIVKVDRQYGHYHEQKRAA